MPSVRLYTRAWCGFCTAAKRLLNNKGVDFEEVDMSGDTSGRAWLAQASGQTTVPQIWVGDTHVGGFSELSAMDRAGTLDPLLASASGEPPAPPA